MFAVMGLNSKLLLHSECVCVCRAGGGGSGGLSCFLDGDVLNYFFYENSCPYYLLLHFYAEVFTGGIDFMWQSGTKSLHVSASSGGFRELYGFIKALKYF